VTDSESSETEYLSVCQSYEVSDGFRRVPFSAHRLVYGSDGQVVDTDMLVGQLFRLPLLMLKPNKWYKLLLIMLLLFQLLVSAVYDTRSTYNVILYIVTPNRSQRAVVLSEWWHFFKFKFDTSITVTYSITSWFTRQQITVQQSG